ncbi:MAG: zinc-binding dehydrogenase [Actinobacteria bacterium]|nr:zinc-binding dehydrogenase [Actinomycetota bacterium]
MRALQIVEYGRPLEQVELPDPAPGPGEVAVRVGAAGICRSDVHYRSGSRPVASLPLVPGHEVAGIVEAVGEGVDHPAVGDRVCLHYLVSCGVCGACRRGAEQFCASGQMIGLDRQGGYAEVIVMPARNAFVVPDGVPLEAAAVMMCSTATSYHALRRGRLDVGDTVAVFGSGGLGASAIQLAEVLGAFEVFAVDVNPTKLAAATVHGAIPVHAGESDPVAQIMDFTAGRGVDVALELVGLPATMRQAVASLAPGGRAVAVGLTHEQFSLNSYEDLVQREAEVIGAADHLASEIPILLELARRGALDYGGVITATVPLEQSAVEASLVALEGFGDDIRTVIVP